MDYKGPEEDLKTAELPRRGRYPVSGESVFLLSAVAVVPVPRHQAHLSTKPTVPGDCSPVVNTTPE